MTVRAALFDRRQLLMLGAAGLGGAAGLVLGFWYGQRKERYRKSVPERPGELSPSVFLSIDEGGVVRVFVPRSELGQGVWTALPMLVADGLDADWDLVMPVQPLASRNYGGQMTAVSSSVRSSWQELRDSGAVARAMLIGAAARAWGVRASDCDTDAGHVVHRQSGRRCGYGALVTAARGLPVPDVTAGAPRLLGRSLPRKDLPAKVCGTATFGLDVRLPGMLFAVLARPPQYGGRLRSCDPAAALQHAGVQHVLETEHGVAVVGTNTWAAMRGRALLELQWHDGPQPGFDDAAVDALLIAAMDGAMANARGGAAPATGPDDLQAEYRVPFLAHATMEPANCTVWLRDGGCAIWAPTQHPQGLQATAMAMLGVQEPLVTVHTTFSGGGFGRRVHDGELREALAIARRLPVPAPLQLVCSREDDFATDGFRPCAMHRLRARVQNGRVTGWHHRIASPSIQQPHNTAADWVDAVAVEGAVDLPYAIAEVAVQYRNVVTPVPVGFWRSVGHSHNAFAVECFVDELAQRLGRDPIELRRELLAAQPRHLDVLEAAVALAAGTPVPTGHARGIAVHASFGSHVAMVAEVADDQGDVRVTRVFAAVDCGRIVHPDLIRSQIEGGVVFGLTAALHGRIRIANAAPVESNFPQYPLLPFGRAPHVEVTIVPSDAEPGGVGEIGVPPIAPAVANALARLGRPRPRTLPIMG